MLTQTPALAFEGIRSEAIARLTDQLAKNRYVGTLRSVSSTELAAIIERILDHFTKWSAGEEEELATCLDYVENVCFALSIPLAEAAYALYVLRDGMAELVPCEDEFVKSETVRQVSSFFDRLVVELLRRY